MDAVRSCFFFVFACCLHIYFVHEEDATAAEESEWKQYSVLA